MTLNPRTRQRLLSVLSVLALFLLWELVCRVFGVNDLILPKPSQVFKVLFERLPALMLAKRQRPGEQARPS